MTAPRARRGATLVAAMLVACSRLEALATDAAPSTGMDVWQRSLALQRLPGLHAEVTLETHTPAGDVVVLRLHALGKLAADAVSRMLMARVTSGLGSFVDTSFLSVEHLKDPDDLWLYLPALGHPKRITSSNLGDSFMGSELTFGDLIQPEPDAYEVMLRPDVETVGDVGCHVIEARPRDRMLERGTGLSREIRWIAVADLLERKVEQYDRRGTLLKVITLRGWTAFGEPPRWLALEREVRNVQTNAFTIATFSDVREDEHLPLELFSVHSLSERTW